jgi:hypothetical protein
MQPDQWVKEIDGGWEVQLNKYIPPVIVGREVMALLDEVTADFPNLDMKQKSNAQRVTIMKFLDAVDLIREAGFTE